jgi:hypothetical protein
MGLDGAPSRESEARRFVDTSAISDVHASNPIGDRIFHARLSCHNANTALRDPNLALIASSALISRSYFATPAPRHAWHPKSIQSYRSSFDEALS